MFLTHDGPDNEVLLEGGREIRRGDAFEVDDERGGQLLATQPVRLIEAAVDTPAPEATEPAVEPDTAAYAAATEPQREAISGEAQLTEGDAPA